MQPLLVVALQDLQPRLRSVLIASPESVSVTRQALEQTMERLPHGARRQAVQLRTPIKESLLWDVLTDYDKLSEFIPNLASSKVLERTGNRVRLNQVGSQQLLGLRFSAQVQLELVE